MSMILNINQNVGGLPLFFDPFFLPPVPRRRATKTTVYPSATPANGITTVFSMPANFVLGSGSVVAICNETFTLFDPTALYAGNTFTISGVPGAYFATFSSAPTPNDANGEAVPTLLSFQVEQPI